MTVHKSCRLSIYLASDLHILISYYAALHIYALRPIHRFCSYITRLPRRFVTRWLVSRSCARFSAVEDDCVGFAAGLECSFLNDSFVNKIYATEQRKAGSFCRSHSSIRHVIRLRLMGECSRNIMANIGNLPLANWRSVIDTRRLTSDVSIGCWQPGIARLAELVLL